MSTSCRRRASSLQSVSPWKVTEPTPSRLTQSSETLANAEAESDQRSGVTTRPPRSGRGPAAGILGAAREAFGDALGDGLGSNGGGLGESATKLVAPSAKRPGVSSGGGGGRGGCWSRTRPTARHHFARTAAAGQRSASWPSEKVGTCSNTWRRCAWAQPTCDGSKEQIRPTKLLSRSFFTFAHRASATPRRSATASRTWHTTAGGFRKERISASTRAFTALAAASRERSKSSCSLTTFLETLRSMEP
mmetsp:Transcript_35450/g.77591  ORF Transcript_35450/g.77591 Transcript_35450/m.77591 type:complete len:248 (-) Transcript_35450:1582-2325(-)